MAFLNLPAEVLEVILEYAFTDVDRSQIYNYRLVNRSIESCVNRLCRKQRFWRGRGPEPSDAGPAIYSRYRPSLEQFRAAISAYLVDSVQPSNRFQYVLRITMAVLMNTKEFIIEGVCHKGFKDIVQESDGFLQAYEEPGSRVRFTKIAQLLAATVVDVGGTDLLLASITEPTSWANFFGQGLPLPASASVRRNNVRILDPDISWAIATAAFVRDTSTIEVLWKSATYQYGKLDLTFNIGNQAYYPDSNRFWTYHLDKNACVNGLSIAIRSGDYKLATFLLQRRPDVVNAYTSVPPHESALEIACRTGSFQMVDLILDRRWGLDYTSWHVFYAIQKAAYCPCLQQQESSNKDLSSSASSCDERMAIIHTLLPLQGAERNPQRSQNNILRQACKWGCMTIIRAIIDDFGTQPANFDAMALAAAAAHGHVQVMEYLLGRATGHFSLPFAAYSLEFVDAAADRAMLAHFQETNAFILRHGPLEPAKLQYLLTVARDKNCPRVIDLLTN